MSRKNTGERWVTLADAANLLDTPREQVWGMVEAGRMRSQSGLVLLDWANRPVVPKRPGRPRRNGMPVETMAPVEVPMVPPAEEPEVEEPEVPETPVGTSVEERLLAYVVLNALLRAGCPYASLPPPGLFSEALRDVADESELIISLRVR